MNTNGFQFGAARRPARLKNLKTRSQHIILCLSSSLRISEKRHTLTTTSTDNSRTANITRTQIQSNSLMIFEHHKKQSIRQCLLLCVFLLMMKNSLSEASYNKKNDQKREMECLATGEGSNSFQCINYPKDMSPIPCINAHPECDNWAKQNECQKNPQYMILHCRKACRSCISLHHGKTQVIQPEISPKVLLQKLIEIQRYLFDLADRKKVDILKKCVNQHEKCAVWSLEGKCTDNYDYMRKECAPACFDCEGMLNQN